jgi:hypothetical protein
MPGFMEVVRIWLEPGGLTLYDNGAWPLLSLGPGTYQVYATLRAAPRSDIYGSAADLTLSCDGTPAATITLRVPDPLEWGVRAIIITIDGTPVGEWSVGAIASGMFTPVSSPYVSLYYIDTTAKWAAYWLDPTATMWQYWTITFTAVSTCRGVRSK